MKRLIAALTGQSLIDITQLPADMQEPLRPFRAGRRVGSDADGLPATNGRRKMVVIADDLPEAYVRLLFGDRISLDVPIHSRPDAVRRSNRTQQSHPKLRHGRPSPRRPAR